MNVLQSTRAASRALRSAAYSDPGEIDGQLEAEKRVLVVIRHPVGGIRTYIHYNYPTLTAAGYRFTFVAPASEQFAVLAEELRYCADAEFVAVPCGDNTRRMALAIRRELRTGRYCLIHSHGFSAATATSIANFGIGARHLFTSHDVIRPAAHFPGLTGPLRQRLLGRLLSRADRIVVVTSDARENHLQYLPALRRDPSKVRTIVHGIDITRFTPNDKGPAGSLRQQLGIPADAFLLGFLGRFMEQKGFLQLIAAFDALLAQGTLSRPVHLLAVGSGDMRCNYLADIAKRPRVGRCISFVDHVANVMPILSELDLLVMPSLWEACGLLAMEAMCAGVPLLGTDCIGLREVLRDSPSMMVPAADVGALTAGLSQAIHSPWTKAARQYAPLAQERFDVAPAAARLLQLFDEMTGHVASR